MRLLYYQHNSSMLFSVNTGASIETMLSNQAMSNNTFLMSYLKGLLLLTNAYFAQGPKCV